MRIFQIPHPLWHWFYTRKVGSYLLNLFDSGEGHETVYKCNKCMKKYRVQPPERVTPPEYETVYVMKATTAPDSDAKEKG